MNSAIIGIVGVAVGAILTGGVDYFLGRREEASARRAASRLYCTDLHKVCAVTEEVARLGTWGPERGSLPIAAYQLNAGTLARSLDPIAWKLVEGSVLGVLRLDEIRANMLDEDRPATPDELDDIRRIRGYIVTDVLPVLDGEAWAIERRGQVPEADVI